jgi:hypothetical protein
MYNRSGALLVLFVLALFFAAVPLWAQNGGAPAPAPAAPPTDHGTSVPSAPPAAVMILNSHEVEGILGREVRSAADENMGRIVDVLVDRSGQVVAAIIDFGGFLGVGSRKIAVDWKALHFPPPADKADRISLELTRDQVKAAPEYQDGKPVVVLGALGKLEPLPSD